jgi:hypothetical protein
MNWDHDWTYEQHRQYVNENIEKARKRRQAEEILRDRDNDVQRRPNRRRRII